MKRTMQTQFLYMKGPEIPEIQFVEFLEKKYLKKIKDHRKKNPDCIQRDLVLTVYLMRGWDWNEKKKESIFLGPPWEVFRKIRVSSNMVVRLVRSLKDKKENSSLSSSLSFSLSSSLSSSFSFFVFTNQKLTFTKPKF